MKKIIYSLMLLAGIQGFSQITMSSYNPYNPNDVPIPMTNGEVWTTNTVEGQGATLYFYINNSYDYDIYIKARVVSIINDDGSNFQFCFGQNCVFSITEGTVYTGYEDKVTIPGGGTNTMCDKIQNENADGTNPKEFVFEFFRVDENGDEIDESITVTYKYDSTASTPNMTLQKLGVQVNNILVNNEFTFTTTSAMTMDLFDINGRNVASKNVNEGTNLYNASGINAGIYIAKFTDKQSQTASVKIVKQ